MLRSVLFHARADDPVMFVSAAGLLGLVATVACLGPARRAARIDPARALGAE
jgi:ABC-type antimicrobial peptide transport system permease subunit